MALVLAIRERGSTTSHIDRIAELEDWRTERGLQVVEEESVVFSNI